LQSRFPAGLNPGMSAEQKLVKTVTFRVQKETNKNFSRQMDKIFM